MRQKSSSNEYPHELIIITPTMVNVIDEKTIEEHEDEDGNKYYTWEEERYKTSEYVPKLVSENTELKKSLIDTNDVLLELLED